jgi:uncharacterized membrane protein
MTTLIYENWPGAGAAAALAVLVIAGPAAGAWLQRRQSSPALLAGFAALRATALAIVLVAWLGPAWVTETRQEKRPGLVVLADASRSMGVPLGGATRLDDVRAFLSRQTPAPKDIAFFGFADSVFPMSSPDDLLPSGRETYLGEAIRVLLADPALATGGLIVLSDGNDTGGDSDWAEIAYAAKGRRIPIHALRLPERPQPPRLLLTDFRLPPAIGENEEATARITIDSRGMATATIDITDQHGKAITRQDLPLRDGRTEHTFPIRLAKPGLHILKARLNSPPSLESQPAHRPLPRFAVTRSRPGTIRVLYMEGSVVSESLYLKRALEQDPQMRVTILYRDQREGPGQDVLQAAKNPDDGSPIYHVEHPEHGFPRTLARLLEYDVVINSDIRREAFSSEQLQATADFVEKHGGGFAMIGGATAFGAGGYNFTEIDRIIPVAMEEEKGFVGTPSFFRPRPDAMDHPILQLDPDPRQNERLWAAMAPSLVDMNAVDREKPGAVVLIEHDHRSNAYGRFKILAVQEIGRGRSLAFTSDTTRYWGIHFETSWGERIDPNLPPSEHNNDFRYYRRFWNNAIRWLAAPRLQQRLARFRIAADPADAEAGRRLRVTLSPVDEAARKLPAWQNLILESTPLETGEPSSALPLEETSTDTKAAIIIPDQPGAILLTARTPDNPAGIEAAAVAHVLSRPDHELAATGINHQALKSLVEISGGQFLDPSDTTAFDRLHHSLPATTETSQIQRIPLLDPRFAFALVLGLLITEWTLRRRW